MASKEFVESIARAVIQLRGIRWFVFHPGVRGVLETWPGFKSIYSKWGYLARHPFDRANRTDTRGVIVWKFVPTSPADPTPKRVYAGSLPSQPSIIRSALSILPPLESFTFIDLGCGKGRPLLVAAEFPFQDIVGVELSPSRAEVARRNVEIMRRRFPGRTPIRVEVQDATTFSLPPGNIVLFLYNPFRGDPILKVRAGVEAALARENRSVFVVYYNPVCGGCFDASPALTRYFAATLSYSKEEREGPFTEDTVIIWQGGSAYPPLAGADARIKIIDPEWRAALEV